LGLIANDNNFTLRSFEINSDQKAIDIKLSGKDTIVAYGETVFYQSNQFNPSDKLSQIIDAEKMQIVIKNLCTSKDAHVFWGVNQRWLVDLLVHRVDYGYDYRRNHTLFVFFDYIVNY
jgi:hypothetical protein